MDLNNLLRAKFPQLTDIELQKEIVESAEYKEFTSGTKIIDIGEYMKFMPMLITGTIKIIREDESGKELLMYYLYPGETCAMSLTCCMSGAPSEIKAIVEDDVELLMIPLIKSEQWMHKYDSWKSFVMQIFQKRFRELLEVIDSLAFRNMDSRLEAYLKEKTEVFQNNILQITHQEIAAELGSSREVITRLLKKMEQLGKVKLGRSRIEVV